MNPPSDVTPSELFLQLLARPTPSEVIDYPREGAVDKDGKPIKVRILAHGQNVLEQARLRVITQLKASSLFTVAELENSVISELVGIGDRVAREILAVSIVGVNQINQKAGGEPVYERIFVDGDHVSKLPDSEIEALWGAFWLVKDRFSPSPASFDNEAEVTAWVERLKEGGAPFLLSALQLPQHAAFTMSLVQRLSDVCRLLDCPPETLRQSLESLLESWSIDTGSSTEPAANSIPSQAPSDSKAVEVLTPEEARAKARARWKQFSEAGRALKE